MLTLDHKRATDPTTCGHKAATLARLRQAGHDVPAGFVIPVGQAAELDTKAIAEALAQLEGPVAVRSSGLAEDSADASFAGQYDSFLSVLGLDAVLLAIRKCVRSETSERALAYGGTAAVAVLVQQMVQADAAGIAFSANPMTGDREEVLVSATRGLGDRLASGQIDGDEWSVRGEHAISIARPQAAVDKGVILRVAALAQALEHQLGAPQDIEWALAGTELVLLQARPITVLPTPPKIETPKGTW
jgi:pyruvate,water dikinase